MIKSVKTCLSILVLTCTLLFSSGCLYANIKGPLDTDVADTTLGSKVGKSSTQSILWLVAWGDSGTEAAARNGDVKVIKHMDEEALIVLFGLYSRHTTVVYGD